MSNLFTLPLWNEGTPLLRGHDAPPTLTAYLAPGDAPRGAVVIYPGGGYQVRAGHEGEPIALWLNTLGIHAFVVAYRVAPYRHPVPLLDAQRAIRTVRHFSGEWGIDPGKIGILGFSAGGHLAAAAGTHFDPGTTGSDDAVDRESSRPDAMILCYPVINFGAFGHVDVIKNLLGDDPEPSLQAALSLETRVTSETPPSFLWHTADDGAVPVEHSLVFASALSRNRVPFELHIYPHGEHGLGLAEGDSSVSQWTAACAIWLKGLGF